MPLDNSGGSEELPFTFKDEQVTDMYFNHEDNSMYVLSGTRLYRFKEGDSAPELLSNKLPLYASNLNVLSTPSGLKVYFIAAAPSGADAIWMLNLKNVQNAQPFILYSDISELAGKHETRAGVYKPSFMIVTNE